MSAHDDYLQQLLQPAVEALGFELWGLEISGGSGKRKLLRLYIDSSQGVGVDDCAAVSHQVSGVLDVEEPISGEYVLEVSSPGMDRPLYQLEQYARYLGQRAKIKLRYAYEGRRNFEGTLVAVEGEDVVLRVDDEEYLLPYDTIERARLVPDFSSQR